MLLEPLTGGVETPRSAVPEPPGPREGAAPAAATSSVQQAQHPSETAAAQPVLAQHTPAAERPDPVASASIVPVSRPGSTEPRRSQVTLVTAATHTQAAERSKHESFLPLAHDSVVAMAQQTRDQFPMSLVYVFPSVKADVGALFTLCIVSTTLWCLLVAGAACLYRRQKQLPQAISSRPEQDFEDWSSGPFDVFQDCYICCWACWCPCIRWADNMDMLGFVNFWVALLIFCGVILLNTVPGGILLWFVASLLWMSYRQQLRKQFEMPHNTWNTYVSDCALYCCCWPCAISQEARHIEEAAKSAHKAIRRSETV